MSDQNPYSAPDAALDGGQDVLYEPKIFSFSGRIGRMRYLAYSFGLSFLVMFLVTFVTAFMSAAGGDGILGMLSMAVMIVAYVAVIFLSIGFAKRRFNDLGRSGWWLLTFLIPLVNLLVSIYLLFFPGTDGPNKFGPAPAANSVGVLIAGWAVPAVFILGIAAAILIPMFAGVAP